MPCYMTGSAESDARMGEREAQERAQAATRVACEAMQELEDDGELSRVSAESQLWWQNHKATDAERRQREQDEEDRQELRKSGLSKLSTEERKALGL